MYAAFTAAAQLPSDAGKVAVLLADPPIYLPWLIFAACVFVLAWSLWPRDKEPEQDSGATANQATTLGTGSHALAGTFNAPIHINPLPAAVQERKYPGRIALPKMDIAADEARRLRERQAEAKRCPEMPIAAAVEHVASVVGDIDCENCYPEARRQIRQAALEERIHVWGKHEIVPDHMQAPLRSRTIWKPIEPAYWENYELAAYSTDPSTDDQPHTQMEEFISGGTFNRYWSLRVRKRQIEQRWHKPWQVPAPKSAIDLSPWDAVNEFSLWQAAHLWVGGEPPEVIGALSPKYGAQLHRLKVAVDEERLAPIGKPGPKAGALEAVTWAISNTPATPETRVSRTSLLDYAESVKERPRFLYGEA
jgi:hypothetical protein